MPVRNKTRHRASLFADPFRIDELDFQPVRRGANTNKDMTGDREGGRLRSHEVENPLLAELGESSLQTHEARILGAPLRAGPMNSIAQFVAGLNNNNGIARVPGA